MSREHKYRVFEPLNNKMHYLDFALYKHDSFSQQNYWILPMDRQCSNKDYTIMNLDTVYIMEYVGFKDKNKKDIYEGDIDSSGYVVTYLANLQGGLGMNAGLYLQRDNFESWSELECNNDIEIIGNIFENPEKAINNCNTDYTKMF